MNEFKELVSLCRNSVQISVNDHRDVYETIDIFIGADAIPGIDPGIHSEMVRTDTLVIVQFYPDSPVGFYRVYHHDIDMAMKEALRVARNNTKSI